MALRIPILIFAAALCLSATGTRGHAESPELPSGAIRDLLESTPKHFGFRSPDPTDERLATLRKRLENKRASPPERCPMLREASGLEAARGNYAQAIEDTQAYLDGCELRDAEKRESFKNLGLFHLALNPPDFERAIEFLRKSADGGKNPDPDVYLHLGRALAITGKYEEAEANARRTIELAKEPREDDYRLLLFCHSMRRDYTEVVALSKKMMSLFPLRNEYLGALGAAYHELGQEDDAFLAQGFRYELGYLKTEPELLGIAFLYLAHDNPDRAARILEKAIRDGRVRRTADHLGRLAHMWSLADEHEKAQLSLARAADMGRNGELDFQAALTYFEDAKWGRAEKFLRRAFREGGLRRPCTAQVLLGYTLYYKDDRQGALRQFEKARIAGCTKEANRSLRSIAAEIAGQRNGLLFSRIAATAGEGDRARAASDNALEAAKKALAAPSAEIRGQWLAAYERDRATARRYLDNGMLEEAREDRATMELFLAGVPADKLASGTLARLRRLAGLSRRRVAVLEDAQSKLERAAGIAARARRKQPASSGS